MGKAEDYDEAEERLPGNADIYDYESFEHLVKAYDLDLPAMRFTKEEIRQFRFTFQMIYDHFLCGPFAVIECPGAPFEPIEAWDVYYLALRGFLGVGKEEAQGWHLLPGEEIPSFEKLRDCLLRIPWGCSPSIAQGSVREACRRYPREVKEFFLSVLREQIVKEKLNHSDQNLFYNACYFLAEYHVEEAFPVFLEWMQAHDMRRILPPEFVKNVFPSVLYATFDGDFAAFFCSFSESYLSDIDTIERFVGQLCIDGVFSQDEMMQRFEEAYFSIKGTQEEGEALATWALLVGLDHVYSKEIRYLLSHNLDSRLRKDMDVTALEERFKKAGNLARGDLLMEDAILFGLKPSE